jgi:hypothetical protein
VTGLSPAVPVIEPKTAGEVAGALRSASDRKQSVVIRGAGSKMDWGRPPKPIDVVLSMRRMNRLIEHQHGDLTATIEAGATLLDVNRELAHHGQWLPLDPPFGDRATIGGLLATNDSGSLRHRFGTPRDLVIGVQLATTDGTLAKAGGRVVKNVAGYDLSKLVCGSFGSLAAIVSATFKPACRCRRRCRPSSKHRISTARAHRSHGDGQPARTDRLRGLRAGHPRGGARSALEGRSAPASPSGGTGGLRVGPRGHRCAGRTASRSDCADGTGDGT